VISHDAGAIQAPDDFNDLIGLRPIAHKIAQADKRLSPSVPESIQDGAKALSIAVNIGKHAYFQE
jgi:hypothetical protein